MHNFSQIEVGGGARVFPSFADDLCKNVHALPLRMKARSIRVARGLSQLKENPVPALSEFGWYKLESRLVPPGERSAMPS
jgi:hypothetical protein